ncbi:carbohydrate binding domain-containing protein [Cohnella rhizosphaerae]|uniref:Alpha-amylase family glycosyl hydrolase n=1 Tax=Cohnella rhizosphaerae TaxID=1457232 RepID=A0A9X4KN75_9BACL|nr:carbohydrate binding domain-containing protein [Cohnella rhizosphaerae]MDG0808024.1 alpha-amylase family glycosyl hydrolase [Cohnella rhizosphaerae]
MKRRSRQKWLGLVAAIMIVLSILSPVAQERPAEAAGTDLKVHFKPPSGWGAPQLYYYQTSPAVSEPVWASSPAMTAESGGWYGYTIAGATSARVIFKDSSNHQTPASGQAGLLRDKEGWYTGSTWTDTNPDAPDTTAPSVPANLTSTAKTDTTVSLSWSASTDNAGGSGLAGYGIYRNGTAVSTAVTGTSFTDTGLTASTAYTYTVRAKDSAGNWSADSAPVTLTTNAPGATNKVTIYYKKGYTTPYIHYRAAGGTWTTTPGIVMDAAEATGYAKKTIDIGSATQLEACFNNGLGQWDSNNGNNYLFGIGTWTFNAGVITAGAPAGSSPDTTAPSVPAGLAVTAKTDSTISISWTASTDNAGGSGVAGYEVYKEGTLVDANVTATAYTFTGLTASTAYSLTVLAKDAAGNKSAQSTALSATTSAVGTGNQATVYYYKTTRGWSQVNLHYAPTGGTWTTSPGVAMSEEACTDWTKLTVNLGSATSMKAAFNNGTAWDNNNGNNYTIGTGITTVRDGVVTANAAVPCQPLPPDTTPPSVPAGVTASATNLTISLSWTASTDNAGGRGVDGYEITRTGGTLGQKTYTTTQTSFSESNLEAQTTYAYTVKAYDKAVPANKSAASAAATAKTGDAPLPSAGGTPLGGDAREDSIYFVVTARFNDGDTSNNRGGQLNVKSGNAANNDPMFRGDFKGLMEKLDYVKALGFSAIWITPVVLNRSDYDFHGYHGYDFYRVDPRLESSGASYQDLINAAHNKGIKIYQDVVYNHSSRWGAKGLFTPTVFGIRDAQWSWYYDEKIPGQEYDGLYPTGVSAKTYNGDLWSTAAPANNTCANWGTPTNNYSSEGYRIYNCQWPSPTSGMFPSTLYHQCWIGNWEGEDARSCWLHEDLADFNTENAQVQDYLIGAYNNFIDMGVDGFRLDTAVHIPRTTWNRRFLPAAQTHSATKFGASGQNFFMFGEVAAFVNDKWNRGSVNHSAQFYTWKERQTYSADDAAASLEMYNYEQQQGTANQPTSNNAFLQGNNYHTPDHSQASGMNVIDMRMHMNFSDAYNAFTNGKDSDDSYNDATYNVMYVSSHDYGPNKSSTAYNGGTDAWAENMSLMWTFRGIPTIMYGDEIEFQAGKTIDCGSSCPLATTRRAYFGDHLAGTVVASGFGQVASATGQVATTLQQPLVKHLQRLNMIRRQIPALQKGQYSTDGISGGMAFKRRFTDSGKGVDSFALVTISGSASYTGIPNGTYKDAITGDVKTVTNGTMSVSLSGKGNLRVYVLDLPGNPAPGKIGTDGPYLK